MLLSDNVLAEVDKSRVVIVFISHEQLFIAQRVQVVSEISKQL